MKISCRLPFEVERSVAGVRGHSPLPLHDEKPVGKELHGMGCGRQWVWLGRGNWEVLESVPGVEMESDDV